MIDSPPELPSVPLMTEKDRLYLELGSRVILLHFRIKVDPAIKSAPEMAVDYLRNMTGNLDYELFKTITNKGLIKHSEEKDSSGFPTEIIATLAVVEPFGDITNVLDDNIALRKMCKAASVREDSYRRLLNNAAHALLLLTCSNNFALRQEIIDEAKRLAFNIQKELDK